MMQDEYRKLTDSMVDIWQMENKLFLVPREYLNYVFTANLGLCTHVRNRVIKILYDLYSELERCNVI